ncbi:MFS transporter [Alkalihalobacillus alcalophilus ATCC 27647 = CGMCC 1.3604]|uniref:MFS transporter n=1 Tax=Alkalihalobacillus alcalophilus ATCC 27647 = CGMCC 1.3604 TaxID=1218173 RepID=A0A4S4JZT9_ALKAL|nr:MFS transporter [Alkalihalobacillus alcalophilus ATCC 27647 = CGMCC 1.3604]
MSEQSEMHVELGESLSPEQQEKVYKRTLWIVVISQIFGGAGLAAGITVGALLAQEMLGTDAYAGLPTALFTLGSALAAYVVGRSTQQFGRRLGLSLGFFAGGIGAIGVVFAALFGQIWLLFLSLFIYGAGTATNLQARYAGTDLAKPRQRATAISIAMVFTTFGAVAGPNLVSVMGDFAKRMGIPSLAGPFILAAVAFLLAGLVIFVLLRPDPFLLAKKMEKEKKKNERKTEEQRAAEPVEVFNKKGVIAGATVMVSTQIVMVAIMTMTPVHMGHHGHGLSEIGLVIAVHVAAMYLPSLVTGVLVDKVGRKIMATAAGVTLILAGCFAAFGPADSLMNLMIALALLGLGWNFGLISGTTIIVDATTATTRAKTQGSVDVLIALAGASGGALSGMVVAHSSFATLSLAGGVLAFLLIPFVVWMLRR